MSQLLKWRPGSSPATGTLLSSTSLGPSPPALSAVPPGIGSTASAGLSTPTLYPASVTPAPSGFRLDNPTDTVRESEDPSTTPEALPAEPVKRAEPRRGVRAAINQRTRRGAHPSVFTEASPDAERISPAAPAAAAHHLGVWEQSFADSHQVPLAGDSVGHTAVSPTRPAAAELPLIRSVYSWRATPAGMSAACGSDSVDGPNPMCILTPMAKPHSAVRAGTGGPAASGGGGGGGGTLNGIESIASSQVTGLPPHDAFIQQPPHEGPRPPDGAADASAEPQPPLQAQGAAPHYKRGELGGAPRSRRRPAEAPESGGTTGPTAWEPPSPSFSAMERAAAAAAAEDWSSLSQQVLLLQRVFVGGSMACRNKLDNNTHVGVV